MFGWSLLQTECWARWSTRQQYSLNLKRTNHGFAPKFAFATQFLFYRGQTTELIKTTNQWCGGWQAMGIHFKGASNQSSMQYLPSLYTTQEKLPPPHLGFSPGWTPADTLLQEGPRIFCLWRLLDGPCPRWKWNHFLQHTTLWLDAPLKWLSRAIAPSVPPLPCMPLCSGLLGLFPFALSQHTEALNWRRCWIAYHSQLCHNTAEKKI